MMTDIVRVHTVRLMNADSVASGSVIFKNKNELLN